MEKKPFESFYPLEISLQELVNYDLPHIPDKVLVIYSLYRSSFLNQFSQYINSKNDETLSSYINYQSGFLYPQGEDEKFDLSDEGSIGRRLKYYSNWCLKNRRGFEFVQAIFKEQDGKRVYARKFKITPRDNTTLLLDIDPVTDYNEYLFKSNIDKNLLNSIQDVIVISEAEPIEDPGPRVIFVNESFSEMTGFSKEEILGINPRLLQGPDTSFEARFNIRRALESWRPIKQIIQNYKKNGDMFEVELNIYPVKDETGWWTHWISIQKNVSEELKEKERLEKQEFFLKKMEEIAKIGCWELDVFTGNTTWTPRVYDIYGLEQSIITDKAQGISFYSVQDREKIESDVERCIKDGTSFNDVYEFVDAKGVKKKVRSTGDALKDSQGNIIKLIGTFQEI